MRVTTIIDEDFVNYKKPAMFIGTISCGGKCCIEADIPLSVCQNDGWRTCAPVAIADDEICRRYLDNTITSAIVIGGLEPFEQTDELFELVSTIRNKFKCSDDIVIYTGYTRDEIKSEADNLAKLYKNIIVKFGRYRPGNTPHYDEVLGVKLASDNQYATRIS